MTPPNDTSDRTRLVLIEQRLDEMGNRLDHRMNEQAQATRELVEAWRSAKTLISFVQLAAKVGAACAALWLLTKGFVGLLK